MIPSTTEPNQPDHVPPAPPEDTVAAHAPPHSLEAAATANTRDDRKFFNTLILAALCAHLYYAYAAQVADVLHLYEGEIILALSVLPVMLWARDPGGQFPTFEAFMFTFANSYAIPLLTGQSQLKTYSAETITSAGMGVIIFQLGAIFAFIATSARPKRGPFWTDEIFSEEAGRYLGYGMVLNTVYSFVYIFRGDLFPSGTLGVLRAVFYGVGIVCTFVQALRWGRGLLKHGEKIYFIANLSLQILILTSSLYLINGISILVLALAGYVTGSRRIPVLICVIAFLFIGVLHNGKFIMRAKYWENSGDGPKHSEFSELPAFYLEWFENGLQFSDAGDDSKVQHKLLERTSLFHMMCLVVSLSPDRQPFLNGETYQDAPAQFVPRYFWDGKPLGHVSTHRLAIYYGLQREEDTAKTTIGFGCVTEAYANFGYLGLGVVGAIIGFCQKKVRGWASASPLLSYPGIFIVLLMSWSFNTEHTVSMWTSSFYQACVSVLGSLVVIRSFLK